jgi:hypothetical protein
MYSSLNFLCSIKLSSLQDSWGCFAFFAFCYVNEADPIAWIHSDYEE